MDTIINTYLVEQCECQPSQSSSEAPIGLVVASYCNFYAPLSFPEPVNLGLRVTHIGKSSVSYEVGIFSGDDNRVVALGGYTHVFVDRQTRRPVREMATPLREGLNALLIGCEANVGGSTSSKL